MHSALNSAKLEIAKAVGALKTRQDVTNIIEINRKTIMSDRNPKTSKIKWNLMANILNFHSTAVNLDVLSFACAAINHQNALSMDEEFGGRVDVAVIGMIKKFSHLDLMKEILQTLIFLYSSSKGDTFVKLTKPLWLQIFADCSEEANKFLNLLRLINCYFMSEKRRGNDALKQWCDDHAKSIISGFRTHGCNIDVAVEGLKFLRWLHKYENQYILPRVAILLLKNHGPDSDVGRTVTSSIRRFALSSMSFETLTKFKRLLKCCNWTLFKDLTEMVSWTCSNRSFLQNMKELEFAEDIILTFCKFENSGTEFMVSHPRFKEDSTFYCSGEKYVQYRDVSNAVLKFLSLEDRVEVKTRLSKTIIQSVTVKVITFKQVLV
jgi:hypothetical protein